MALHVGIDTNEEECLKTLHVQQASERGDTEAINRIHDSHIHKAKFRSTEISKLWQDTFAISSLLSEDIVYTVGAKTWKRFRCEVGGMNFSLMSFCL